MNGIVQLVTGKEGQYGKFSEVKIDNRDITAFKEFHNVAVTLSPGDSVEYSFELKGKYPRFTSLTKLTGGSVSSPSQGTSSPSRPSEFITRDESVLVSYAKDIFLSDRELTTSDAVNAVMEMVALVKKGMKENPT